MAASGNAAAFSGSSSAEANACAAPVNYHQASMGDGYTNEDASGSRPNTKNPPPRYASIEFTPAEQEVWDLLAPDSQRLDGRASASTSTPAESMSPLALTSTSSSARQVIDYRILKQPTSTSGFEGKHRRRIALMRRIDEMEVVKVLQDQPFRLQDFCRAQLAEQLEKLEQQLDLQKILEDAFEHGDEELSESAETTD